MLRSPMFVRCATLCSLAVSAACNVAAVDPPTAEEIAEELKQDPTFVAQLRDRSEVVVAPPVAAPQPQPHAPARSERSYGHRVSTRTVIGGDEVPVDLADLVVPDAPDDGTTAAVGPDEPFYPLFRLVGTIGCAGSNDCYERIVDPGTGGTSGNDARNILPLDAGVLVGGRALFANFTTCDIRYTVSVLDNGIWADSNLSVLFEAGQGGLTTFIGEPVVLDADALVSYHVTREAGPCAGSTFTSSMSLKYQY